MRDFDDFCNAFRRRANAAAIIRGSENYPEIRGRVRFYGLRGGVIVRAEIAGLPDGKEVCEKPVFAFHIHSGTECLEDGDAFSSAMGHYDKNDCPHPFHSGDMPPLFSANGRAFSAFFTDRFTVSQILGKTVIIHDRPDDFTTQPSGNAGKRIACGIITPVR